MFVMISLDIIIIIIIIIIIRRRRRRRRRRRTYLTANGLSPGGSGYYVCT